MEKHDKAKVFWTGRSQAVRLPREYRFEVTEVSIRRDGRAVVLEPVDARPWPTGYFSSFGPLGDDFEAPEPLPETPHRDAALDDL
ncbi:MAG: AbrB/MazE/SpoVT family DNA-binding domain-containing protein [Deltaproteobacteria bacterium]|nr:AbrB/MazE/SpoVT family DNA-binding domain-containing protein [Deltaproteobacteria bacterium]